MKQTNIFKKLLFVAFLGATGAANAQIHPLAFGALGVSTTTTNYYKDYVGLRFEVNSPAVVAGDKQYTTAYAATGGWGGAVITPITNTQIIMPQAGDSLCNSTITVSMAGKIAFVYRGGSIEFGDKANKCQLEGAIACVIVNNIPGGPVGMGAGALGGGVHIPVFMISKEDGDAIDAQYNAGDTARMTITPWGQGYANDLGFVPGGIALWHDYAIPANQITSGSIFAYKGLDGAFVANYGSGDMSNVTVTSALTFSPAEGGAPTPVHSSSTPTQTTFKALDSIYAFFSPTEYDVTATGKGRFDLHYTISSTTTDDFPADDTITTSFYATDSVYSKGRYDLTKAQPVNTIYEAFNMNSEFVWGPMYYVANGGSSISKVQYSLEQSSTSTTPIVDFTAASGNNIYLFKWVDGSNSQSLDGFVEDGELTLVGLCSYSYLPGIDTNGAVIKASIGDPSDGIVRAPILLTSNSWYYVAVDVPASLFLGCDGLQDAYPRIFGRFHETTSVIENNNIVAGTSQSDIASNASLENYPVPSTNTFNQNSVDSFNYASMKGLIPSVAMIINATPDTTNKTAVNNVVAPMGTVTVYPNPASDYLNVSLNLDQTAPIVTYTLLDGLARIVGKEVHNNVKTETYTIPTANMAAGNYYLIINANNQVMSKKFVVVKQ